jgi:hypothetical protein
MLVIALHRLGQQQGLAFPSLATLALIGTCLQATKNCIAAMTTAAAMAVLRRLVLPAKVSEPCFVAHPQVINIH